MLSRLLPAEGLGKIVYKVGGKIFKSAPEAWQAAKKAKLLTAKGKKLSGAPAKRTTGETVLGSYPEYVKLSDDLNARRFEIPLDAWNKMSEAEKWAANKKFLDRTINKGDAIILSNDAHKAKPGSYFSREIDYLKSKGYTLSDDGLSFTPPAPKNPVKPNIPGVPATAPKKPVSADSNIEVPANKPITTPKKTAPAKPTTPKNPALNVL